MRIIYENSPQNDELYHYGVKGMKWGVNMRYRDKGGSYTKAGVGRFDASMQSYEKAHNRYKAAKAQYKSEKKNNSLSNNTAIELSNSRLARQTAKRKLDKDYAHLKQDKLADKGKDLYARGKTITGNRQTAQLIGQIGSLALSGAAFNRQTHAIGDDKMTKRLALAGAGALAVAGAKNVYDEHQAKKLRAYYSHTSKY